MRRISRSSAARAWLVAAVVLVAASCGGSDDGGASPPATEEVPASSSSSSDDTSAPSETAGASETDTGTETDVATDTAAPAEGGAGSGTLILGGETIAFDSARCFLEEQDAAAGGGKILFVVQASGVDMNGDELLIDVSRFDEDSQFSGDAISVDIGDPFSDSAVSWTANASLGTVTINGSTVSADGLNFTSFDNSSVLEGSFSISC